MNDDKNIRTDEIIKGRRVYSKEKFKRLRISYFSVVK